MILVKAVWMCISQAHSSDTHSLSTKHWCIYNMKGGWYASLNECNGESLTQLLLAHYFQSKQHWWGAKTVESPGRLQPVLTTDIMVNCATHIPCPGLVGNYYRLSHTDWSMKHLKSGWRRKLREADRRKTKWQANKQCWKTAPPTARLLGNLEVEDCAGIHWQWQRHTESGRDWRSQTDMRRNAEKYCPLERLKALVSTCLLPTQT